MIREFVTKQPKILLLTLIFLAGVVAGLPTLRQEFFGDDTILIIENPDVRSLKNIPNLFRKDFFERPIVGVSASSLIGYYRPLTKSSFALDWFFWKRNPAGYHLTNIVIHAFIGVCLFLILLEFGVAMEIASWMAILFAVFPTHDQAISLINARSDLMCSLGLLIVALGCIRKSAFWVCAGSVLSLFSKEQGVFSIFVVLAVILSLHSPRREYLKIVVSSFICLFFYFLCRHYALLSSTVSPTNLSTVLNIRNFILIGKLVEVQSLLALGFDTDFIKILLVPDSLFSIQVVFGWLIVVSVFIGLAWAFFRCRKFFLPFSILVIGMIPMLAAHRLSLSMPLGDVIIPAMSRWSYIPSIGICMLVGIFCSRKNVYFKVRFMLAMIALVFVFSLWMKLPNYQNNKSLNMHMLTVYQQIPIEQLPQRVQIERISGESIVFAEHGDRPKAIAHLSTALKLSPDDVYLQTNLGKMYADIQDYDHAIYYLRKSLSLVKISQDKNETHYKVSDENARNRPMRYAMLAEVYRRAGMFDESESAIRMSLQGDPTNPNYMNNLAVAVGSQGRLPEAFEIYMQVLDLDPCYGPAREALESILRVQPAPSLKTRYETASQQCKSPKTLDLTR